MSDSCLATIVDKMMYRELVVYLKLPNCPIQDDHPGKSKEDIVRKMMSAPIHLRNQMAMDLEDVTALVSAEVNDKEGEAWNRLLNPMREQLQRYALAHTHTNIKMLLKQLLDYLNEKDRAQTFDDAELLALLNKCDKRGKSKKQKVDMEDDDNIYYMLKERLQLRGLSTTGSNVKLVSRLLKDLKND